MTFKPKLASLLVLIPAGFLTACDHNSRVEVIKPPIEWMTCSAEPPVPEVIDDDGVANFIIDLRAAGADCRSKIVGIKEFFDRQ